MGCNNSRNRIDDGPAVPKSAWDEEDQSFYTLIVIIRSEENIIVPAAELLYRLNRQTPGFGNHLQSMQLRHVKNDLYRFEIGYHATRTMELEILEMIEEIRRENGLQIVQ